MAPVVLDPKDGRTDPVVTGGLTRIDGVDVYRIDGVEDMEPFLTTVVSEDDLWMFVSSTGALTAGRVDADHAIFPYDTDDKLHRLAGLAGPVTVIARTVAGRRQLWRPFGAEPTPGCTRSIAKSVLGDRLVFEEHHEAWGIVFRATWAPSARHGWVRETQGAPGAVTGRLADAYGRIRSGLGFRKQPAEFGAFPTDCYSHTPAHAGAQQPGMTGQVKEEVLARLGELGLRVRRGRVSLSPACWRAPR